MNKTATSLIILLLVAIPAAYCQSEFVRSTEGRPVLLKKQLIMSCLKSMNKTRTDKTALSICECQANTLDLKFSNKQYRRYTNSGIIKIDDLVKEDTLVEQDIKNCFTGSGKSNLLLAEASEISYIEQCIKNLRENTDKTLNTDHITRFCACQLALVKSKKISDSEMSTLSNPNSLLFYEMMYKCGDPFTDKTDDSKNWNENDSKYISGPESDTINILTVNGMTYIKVGIGNMLLVWLFDTGASDLLINTEMEGKLKNQNILSDQNYLGYGEYEMANGVVDSCRKYKIDKIQIGQYSVDNITVAVTEKGKRIIVGKSLLNKFRSWALSNEKNELILKK